MDNTKDSLAYGVQEKRELLYRQAKQEAEFIVINAKGRKMSEDEREHWISNRYEELCEFTKITAF